MKIFKKGAALCLTLVMGLSATTVTAHAAVGMNLSGITNKVQNAVNNYPKFSDTRTDVLSPTATNIKTITINEDIGSIEVLPAEDGKLKLEAQIAVKSNIEATAKQGLKAIEAGYEISGAELKLGAYMAGTKNSASSHFNRKFNTGKNTYYTVDLTLYVPQDSEYNYDLSMDVGNISISNIKGNIEASADVGSITISNTKGNIEAAADVGNVTLNATTGAYDIKTDVGDVELTNIQITGDGEFKADVGKIGGSIKSISNTDLVKFQTEIGAIDLQLSRSINCEVRKKQGVLKSSNTKSNTTVNGKGGTIIELISEIGNIQYSFE